MLIDEGSKSFHRYGSFYMFGLYDMYPARRAWIDFTQKYTYVQKCSLIFHVILLRKYDVKYYI